MTESQEKYGLSEYCPKCEEILLENKKNEKLYCPTCKRHYERYQVILRTVKYIESENQGTKHDSGKLRYELIPWEILDGLAQVYTIGAEKYGVDNWRKSFEWSRIIGAIFRHFIAWLTGTNNDRETGLHHLDCVAWNVLTLRWMQKYGKGNDDRYVASDYPKAEYP